MIKVIKVGKDGEFEVIEEIENPMDKFTKEIDEMRKKAVQLIDDELLQDSTADVVILGVASALRILIEETKQMDKDIGNDLQYAVKKIME